MTETTDRLPDDVYSQLSEGFDERNALMNAEAAHDMNRNRIISLFTDTVEKRRNYHEVHPDGDMTRGQIDDVKYEQVIVDGKVTFTVAVRENLIGMFYDADTWAIVDLHTLTIVEGRSLGMVAEHMRESFDPNDEDYTWEDGKVIVQTAQMESDCPRWRMSW